MISSEVQRTLVKSPPELWAEISDPVSLARHLGDFGEIRITRVEPEQRVEWQAGDTSGSVVIKPSGWGTKVKLTVKREFAQPSGDTPDEEPVESQDAPEPETVQTEHAAAAETAAEAVAAAAPVDGLALDSEPAAEPEFDLPHAESGREPEFEPELPADASAEDDAEIEQDRQPGQRAEPEPERRRGFFARLFGRRRAAGVGDAALDTGDSQSPEDLAAAVPDLAEAAPASTRYNALAVWSAPVEPQAGDEPTEFEPIIDELQPVAEPTPVVRPTPAPTPAPTPGDDTAASDDGPAADISAEIEAAEEVAAERVTAVLTGVLDRLGAAHHRPFSRA